MNIKRKPTPHGLKSVLTYWYKGRRYRPTLGYNLTADQEREAALRLIHHIHDLAGRPVSANTITFSDFIPTYLQRMELRKRLTTEWCRKYVITPHLTPHFGSLRLRDIRLLHGEAYIAKRRAEGAADGTIERECVVLSAIMNLAVQHEYLDRNRLRSMPVPKGHRRERILTLDELPLLYSKANPQLRRAITVALNTGLRESKIVELDQSFIVQREDGPWLTLPKPRSPFKGNPDRLPLNRQATEALTLGVTYLHGRRIFDNFKDGQALGKAFAKLVKRCGLADLHFHDLRHTFATALENLDVGERTIDLLMGHKIAETGERYRHGGPGRDRKLREAVAKLEGFWAQVPHEVPLGGQTEAAS
ncbi:MAG: hypothetical protein OJF50_006270 [Nitrospira sp.]|jgi:integrase|nr:hypothetical protein [Nitrospira sp.]